MNDKSRLKAMMKIYKEQEIEAMNYIFKKPKDNKYFTEAELKLASTMNLFNKKISKTIQ